MLHSRRILIALLFTFLSLINEVKNEVTQNADGTGTIRFEPPTLNDEESHSTHMPDMMKCDACKAIAYQVNIFYYLLFYCL